MTDKIVLIVGSVLLYSCSSTPIQPLSTSSRIPAGRGTISVRTDPNQNTSLEIAVNHLAPPDRVSAGATTYVVWLEPADPEGRPLNLGALSVDKDLNGNLQTVTPFQSFKLFVTAEPSATMLQPSGEPMLWTKVDQGRVG